MGVLLCSLGWSETQNLWKFYLSASFSQVLGLQVLATISNAIFTYTKLRKMKIQIRPSGTETTRPEDLLPHYVSLTGATCYVTRGLTLAVIVLFCLLSTGTKGLSHHTWQKHWDLNRTKGHHVVLFSHSA